MIHQTKLRIPTNNRCDTGCPNCLLLNICLHEPARQVGNLRSGWKTLWTTPQISCSNPMHVFFRVAPVGEAFRQVRNMQGDEVFFSLYNTGGVSDHHPRLPDVFWEKWNRKPGKNPRRNNDKVTSTQPGWLLPLRPPPLPRPICPRYGFVIWSQNLNLSI